MSTIILNLPDELITKLTPMQERLPELLELSLQQPPLPARLYRTLFHFLVSEPSAEELQAFTLPEDALDRLQTLRDRERFGTLIPLERAELDELEHIDTQLVVYQVSSLPEFATPGESPPWPK